MQPFIVVKYCTLIDHKKFTRKAQVSTAISGVRTDKSERIRPLIRLFSHYRQTCGQCLWDIMTVFVCLSADVLIPLVGPGVSGIFNGGRQSCHDNLDKFLKGLPL